MKRDFCQSSQIMLSETCQVFKPAENTLYSHSLFVGRLEPLRSMTAKLSVNPEEPSDAFALVLRIRNNWQSSTFQRCIPQVSSAVLRISQEFCRFNVF